VPRRSRGHVYRKRTVPPVSPHSRSEPVLDETVAVENESSEPALVPPAQPAPYVRRGPIVSAARPPAPAPRPARGLVTDYGYVVSEMKRIGLTFGGLIVLLVIISRFLQR
jgi:hypothetical protein